MQNGLAAGLFAGKPVLDIQNEFLLQETLIL